MACSYVTRSACYTALADSNADAGTQYTDGITGARPVSRWTYFYVCGTPDNADCGSAHPAPPFGKFVWDSNPQNAPAALVGSHGSGTTSYKYYYMWRFGWVFLLLTLFFETLAFFTGFLACCGRLGAAISFLLGGFALFLYSIAAALTTYVCPSRCPPLFSPAA